ncbi:microfibrillar-associated protein 2 [Gymnodraco acuticeps]|uniref:Microfibrillar-associated protein 2 n=1 Tax=Gymnodraco acuticeps TaxID=8218 RepID=A0A6P8V301_GYMAC|nr:microfibrillar-associated protein 2 [Gymnodraco acuticeps]
MRVLLLICMPALLLAQAQYQEPFPFLGEFIILFPLSLRRVYVINKEVCVRTVCAHEELLRADMCRDQFSRCGVAALSGQCSSIGGSCGKSCGGC